MISGRSDIFVQETPALRWYAKHNKRYRMDVRARLDLDALRRA